MQSILQITLVVFAIVALGESLRIWQPQRVKPCTRCPKGTKCILKNGRPYCQPVACSLPAVTGFCRAYFTRYFYNTTSKRCEDFVYGGCGGNKNNFVNKVDCKLQCDDPVCPPPLTIHQCKVAPCDVNKCLANPKAKCINNYCGGCFADFYHLGQKVNCNIHPCSYVKCASGEKCVLQYGKPRCVQVQPKPCLFSICQPGHKCVVVNGKGKCVLEL